MSSSALNGLDGETPIVDRAGRITSYLARWERGLRSRVEASAFATPAQQAHYSGQSAALVATAVVIAAVAPVYLIWYDLRIAQAAGVSSAAQITVQWTQGGIVQTKILANVNGNTTTSRDEGAFPVRPDAGTNITVAVSYASNPAGVMQWEADFIATGIG